MFASRVEGSTYRPGPLAISGLRQDGFGGKGFHWSPLEQTPPPVRRSCPQTRLGLAYKFHTAKVNEDDLEIWLKESAELAQKFAYAEPVLSATGTAELTRGMRLPRDTARSQAALAQRRSGLDLSASVLPRRRSHRRMAQDSRQHGHAATGRLCYRPASGRSSEGHSSGPLFRSLRRGDPIRR